MLAALTSQEFTLIAASAVGGFLLAFLILMVRLSSVNATAREREKGSMKAIAELEAAEAGLKDDLTELRHAESILLKRQGELEHQVQALQTRHLETSDLLNTVEARFTDTFKALSSDSLKVSQQQFLQLAKSTFQTEQKEAQGELSKREQAVAHLVKPVAESLDKMQSRIGEIEKAREGAYATLKEQVTQLHSSQLGLQKETSQLVKALRQPTGRGQWGEMQLQRVVEMAGMQQHCDFTTQTTTTTDEGKKLRPDLIVNLPGGKKIVVDSKTPMAAYLDALEADNDDERAAHLVRHAAQVSTHIRQLASKNYQAQFQPAPEFVVLFLPSESFFSAALTQDSSLLEQGVDQNVILATPTTLIALLRSVSYGWRQEALAENARKISDVGRELHKRLATFSAHLSKVGRALDTSVKSYNSAVSSLETRVLPSARKFENLEAAESNTLLEAPANVASLATQPRGAEVPKIETK
ncbi:DNA recombination protein RmuC, partial [Akkermansiaceae bacterium]|nr:DNA recombination protein RmuC [Akkermansiaceae bacterium]